MGNARSKDAGLFSRFIKCLVYLDDLVLIKGLQAQAMLAAPSTNWALLAQQAAERDALSQQISTSTTISSTEQQEPVMLNNFLPRFC